MNNDPRLIKLAEAVIAHIRADAEETAQITGRTVHSVISAEFRGYIKDRFSPTVIKRDNDMRCKDWHIRLMFWRFAQGSDDKQFEAETDPEVVTGLNNLPDIIRSCVEEISGPQPLVDCDRSLGIAALTSQIRHSRGSMSRQNGTIILRVVYDIEPPYQILCQVYISSQEFEKEIDSDLGYSSNISELRKKIAERRAQKSN